MNTAIDRSLNYASEEEAGVSRPSAARLGIEFSVVAAIMFVVLRYGGFHQHNNPLAEVTDLNWVSALIFTALITCLYAIFRFWRIQLTEDSLREGND